jgi:hypothetical protein
MTSNIYCSNYLGLQEEEEIESINVFDTQGLIAESEEQQNYLSYGFYNNDFDYDNLDCINKEPYPLENDLNNSKINEENLVSNKEGISPSPSQKNVFWEKKHF